MAGPTIIAHGTEEQKARYLQPLLSAEEIWCQGFSEPGAGSDLAGVRTSAREDDGDFVVNGQKVWSSFAHIADFCILLTRSDPDSTRHAGLTYLIVDMHAPGVEVRPLRQITGEAEFNEIFFSDVDVPAENLLGEVGGGWQVAMTTLLHERGTLGFALQATLEVQIRKLVGLARGSRRRPAAARPDRPRVDRAAGAALHELPLALARSMKTGLPGPEGSISKLVWSEANQRVTKLALELLGPDARDRRGQRAVRRLLAVPAAAQPRQHHRGGHVGGAPQHRRRARARPPLVAADGLHLHPRAGGASRAGTRVPRRDARADLGAARRARLDGRVGRGGGRRRRALLRRRGRPLRGAGARAVPRPLLLDGRAHAPGSARRI